MGVAIDARVGKNLIKIPAERSSTIDEDLLADGILNGLKMFSFRSEFENCLAKFVDYILLRPCVCMNLELNCPVAVFINIIPVVLLMVSLHRLSKGYFGGLFWPIIMLHYK